MREMTRTLQIETPVGPVSITATAEAIVSLYFGRRVPVGSQLLAHGPELSEMAGSELSIGREPELLKGAGSEQIAGREPELLKGAGSDLSIGREPELSEGTGLEQPAEAASEPEKSTQESTTPEERACRLLWLAAVELGEYFAGREPSFRAQVRADTLACTPEDLRRIGPAVTRVAAEAPACVFGGRDIIEASDAGWNVVELLG